MYRILDHFFYVSASQGRSVWYRWLIFVIFCLLVSGCSPPPPENEARHLIAIGDTIYHEIEDVRDKPILQSQDGGRTWQRSQDVPSPVWAYVASPPSLPMIECVASQPDICYRITGEAQIEKTTDDGESWTTVWASPSNRHRFMLRFFNNILGGSCTSLSPSFIPQDVAIVDFGNGEYMVAVAMGNSEGVLVLTAAGEASRHHVGCATPTPYRLTSVPQAIQSTLIEIIVLVLAILIANPFYIALLKAKASLLKKIIKVVAKLYFVLLMIGVLLAIIQNEIFIFYLFLFPFWLPVVFVLFILPSFSGMPAPWEWQSLLGSYVCLAILSHVYVRRKERLPSRLVDLATFFLAYLPFPLWTLGIIAPYAYALGLSLVLAGGTWLIGYQLTNKIKGPASTVESEV